MSSEKLPEGFVSFEPWHSRLSRHLGSLYSDVSSCQRIATISGLDTSRVAFDARVAITWVSIISEALRQGALLRLLAEVLRDYPEDLVVPGILNSLEGNLAVGSWAVILPVIESISLTKDSLLAARVVGREGRTVGSLFDSTLYHPVELSDSITNKLVNLDEVVGLVGSSAQKILIIGPSGCGKTLALMRLFAHAKQSQGLFLLAADVNDLLSDWDLPPSHSSKKIMSTIYLDGLDEALPVHDRDRARNMGRFLMPWESIVATSREDILGRGDFRVYILRHFDRILKIQQWDEKSFRRYLQQATGTDLEFLSYIESRDFPFSPLMAAMFAAIYDEPSGASKYRKWLGESLPEGVAGLCSVYERFLEGWCSREAERWGFSGGMDLYTEVMAYWRDLARSLHKNRVTGLQLVPPSVELRCSGAWEVASSLLRQGPMKTFRAGGFLHSSILDYFCAQAYLEDLSTPTGSRLDVGSIMMLPSSYEINAFLRGELARLRGDPMLLQRTKDRIIDLYKTNLEAVSEYRTLREDSFYVLRNNLMYTLGRLPGFDEPDLLEGFFSIERHPLVRYTIGMNGIYSALETLAWRVLNAVMEPRTEDDYLIQEANLFCHLYYYGDISSLELPRRKVSWDLTLRGLARHFGLGEVHYRPFWSIDLATAVQLSKRFGGGGDFVKRALRKLRSAGEQGKILGFWEVAVIEYVARAIGE